MPGTQSKMLKRVEGLFFRLGIRTLTMDDVARELGISKKTLYLHVENKDDLVKKVVLMSIEEDKAAHEAIFATAQNAIDEMLGIAQHILVQVRKVKPSMMFELQRHYPDAWAIVDDFHTQNLKFWTKTNIERGIAEGNYRPDLNPEIVASLYVAATTNICNEQFFPLGKFALEELIRQFMTYHMAGLCSEKGRELLSKRLEHGALALAN